MKISEGIMEIEVSKLSKSRWNPRENYGQIEELGDTISQDGIIEPLIVVERDGKYEVIVGERRRYAAEKLKMKTLPCRIAEGSDKEILMLIAIEEYQKEELSAVERAKLYSSMIQSGWTQEELSSRIGVDRSTIAHILQINRLPEEAKTIIVRQRTDKTPLDQLLTYSKIDPIVGGNLPDKVANFLVKKIVKKGMSREKIRKEVNNYNMVKRSANAERDKGLQKRMFQDLDENFESILDRGHRYFEPEEVPKFITIEGRKARVFNSEEERQADLQDDIEHPRLEFKYHVPTKDILAILEEEAKVLGYEPLCQIREVYFENPDQLKAFLDSMKKVGKEYPYTVWKDV
jgi:ParB/RepB/Spo0J family partition protein